MTEMGGKLRICFRDGMRWTQTYHSRRDLTAVLLPMPRQQPIKAEEPIK